MIHTKTIIKIIIFAFINFFASPSAHATNGELKSNLSFRLTKSIRNPKSNILLIHGLTSSKETWNDRVHQSLSTYGNVWAIDLPGYGDSFELPFETQERIIGSVIDFIEVNKLSKLVIIGHSLGGKIAIILARKLNIEKLVIEDMETEPRKFYIKKCPKEFQKGFASIENMVKGLKKNNYYDRTISNILNNHVVYKNSRYYSKISPFTDWEYNRNINSKWSIKDDWESLPGSLPVMILKAEKNSSISRYGLQYMKSTKSKLKVSFIKGSTHSIHNSMTEEFLRNVNDFVKLN